MKIGMDQEALLDDFKVYLLETGRVTSKMTIESYLGNIRQLLIWLDHKEKELEVLDRMLVLKYLEYLKDLKTAQSPAPLLGYQVPSQTKA